MCDYCTSRMYHEAHTPEERLSYRLENFVKECERSPMNLYRCDSVAKAIKEILTCEFGAQATEEDARADLREISTDADVEDALADAKLEREAK